MGIPFGQQKAERQPGDLIFHPSEPAEYNLPQNFGQIAQQFGFRPRYKEFMCGECGSATHGRIIADRIRESDESTVVFWCLCTCEAASIITEKGGVVTSQYPLSRAHRPDKKWPKDLAALYEEAAKSYASGAYTAASMVCRKILMSCACHEQERAGKAVQEGKSFTDYVDYIMQNVLTFEQARKPIDAIRGIGNEANHHIAFVSRPDAERSMNIVKLMLDTIYVFPSA